MWNIKLALGMLTCLTVIFLMMPLTLSANILVISPHPDDDIIMASGVIHSALRRGELVRVVYMTNGDYSGITRGYARQAEAVDAQLILSMEEDNLIFLGYPDGYLSELYDHYPLSTDVFVSPNGQSITYGNRGLGRSDYHTYLFGSAAYYNRNNLVSDLKSIIVSFQPDHIIVTSELDGHGDHKTTYRFLRAALSEILSEQPTYNPTIHKTIIRPKTSTDWPNPLDPSVYFSEIPDLSSIGLIWENRESLDVPLSMQSTFYPDNLKHRAADAHVTQNGSSALLGRFVHKDEFFWVEQCSGSNQPPVANAGIDQIVEEGTVVYLDGSKSFDHSHDPITYTWRQVNGTRVILSDPGSVNPAFTVPTGLLHDEILTFELTISDGAFVTLPDHTNVLVGSSAPQPVYSSINSQIISISASSTFRTSNVDNVVDGCVNGYPSDPTCEWVSQGRQGEWVELHWASQVSVGKIVLYDRPNVRDQVLSGTLVFSDGSSIQLGPLENSARAVEYKFPRREITWLRLIIDTVSSTTSTIGLAEIEVFEARINVAPLAYVTASTENCPYQCAIKAVDGHADGYPGDFTREWSTKLQRIGAWLELSWPVEHEVDMVVLYDRPNNTDQILSATLTFSDGTSMQVGPLVNSGQGVTYSFPKKRITWLRLTVDAVKARTANIGLAEIEVFEIGVSNGNLTPQVNIAPDASVTASSQNTQPDQRAVKAIDGCVDGYPGDITCEWATIFEKTGAWIEITWPMEHSVNKVILYDRCNSSDRILSGTLTFSDGTSIQVAPLDNSCRGMMYVFPAKMINWLRFSITGVSSGTVNIGLAEIEVFEENDLMDAQIIESML